MAAEVASLVTMAPGGRSRSAPVIRPVAGVLADGTPFYAPVGEVLAEGSRVTCHLCGRPFRSVAAHLASHGWTKERYCEAFGLERSQSLEGQETRKLRAASLAARLVFDPAIRAGSAAGRERARRGELTRVAASQRAAVPSRNSAAAGRLRPPRPPPGPVPPGRTGSAPAHTSPRWPPAWPGVTATRTSRP